jgi:hypothetical protein
VATTLASLDPPVTNYDVEQVIVNFWIAVAEDRSIVDPLLFCIDEVSPCSTVYNSEEDFRAAAGLKATYSFESHGLSEDVSDLVPSPVSASDFAGHFGIAYSNMNTFNVAYEPGSPCNASGDRSLFTHSVVADDYSLTFSDFGGDSRSIRAFGLTVCDFGNGVSEPVSIAYDTGTESGTLLVVPSGQPDETSNFVGIVVCSGSAFDSITLTLDDNDSGFQRFDDVIYSGDLTVVPAPVTRPYVLHQNDPNPFNPSTTLRFDLQQAGPVELTIYDVSGRRVRTLVQETRAEGPHQVIWRGLDESGRQVASGVYLYKLKAGSFVETRRMVLLK